MKERCLTLLLVKLLAEACNLTKSNNSPRVFSRFLNCANVTKSCKASHINLKSPYQLFADFIHILVLKYEA